MTSYECFTLAERIERLARDIYAQLAEHPATPLGLKQLFLLLADEEEHHAQLLAAALRGSPLAHSVTKEAATRIEAVASELEAFLVEATTSRSPGDLPRILERLVDMEERFAFVHAEELTRGADPATARLFTALARQDERHRKLLEEARPAPAAPPLSA
jgi:rubrerythrin